MFGNAMPVCRCLATLSLLSIFGSTEPTSMCDPSAALWIRLATNPPVSSHFCHKLFSCFFTFLETFLRLKFQRLLNCTLFFRLLCFSVSLLAFAPFSHPNFTKSSGNSRLSRDAKLLENCWKIPENSKKFRKIPHFTAVIWQLVLRRKTIFC